MKYDDDDDYDKIGIIGISNNVYAINPNIMLISNKKTSAAREDIISYKCACPMPTKSKKKKSMGFNFDLFGGLKNIFSSKDKSTSDAKPKTKEIKKSDINADNFDISYSNSTNNKNDNMTQLIMSQDVIEGSWDEDYQTTKLQSLVTLDKFNKIKNKIIALKKESNENKIIYTILVVYYLKTKCTNKLNQYRLVINKAIKFLNKNGINYDNIVSDI